MNLPDPGRRELERWAVDWQAALTACQSHGQRDDGTLAWGWVRIGPPASAEELAAAEAASGVAMPEAIRSLFRMAGSVDVAWQFEDDVEPPDPFGEVFAGGFDWSLERVASSIVNYRGWLDAVFPNPDDPYDAVWHGKYPWLHVANGDVIAIDDKGRVVYLSHDFGEGHGYILGREVFEFLDSWTRLGCPGPEDWVWMPFVAARGEGLDPDGEAGLAWRKWFGIP